MKKAISNSLIAVMVMVFSFHSAPSASAFSLYAFSSHSFTSCSTSGRVGPTLSDCRTRYGTAWDENSENFTMVGGIQYWTVPFTGRYYIDAYGAGGGGNFAGGGARIADTFDLTQGEVIRILVGQGPTPWYTYIANGGGGGTFVTRSPHNNESSILLIAGGGGGIESGTVVNANSNGSISTAGNAGSGVIAADGAGSGGTAGGGGSTATTSNSGGGGGGFTGNGANNAPMENNGGTSYINGGVSVVVGANTYAVAGGFGGGGGANGRANGGGSGGGGGYSGGGGSDNIYGYSGGGGGSYVAGLNINRVMTTNARPYNNNGGVTITALSQPTLSLSVTGGVKSVTKGQSVTLTATVNQLAQVNFYADGKKISGCLNKATSAGSVSCSWKPSTQKSVNLTAAIVVGGSVYVTSPVLNLGVTRRTGLRG